MKNKDVQQIVENYYRASSSLMNIGTIEGIPAELKEICLNASAATIKIINYVNDHKHELYESKKEVWCPNCGCSDLEQREEDEEKIYYCNGCGYESSESEVEQ